LPGVVALVEIPDLGLPARSTSVNTDPKPVVVAGVELLGWKKRTSTNLLSMAVNSRWGLKTVNRLE
jgi:hypothetical protein